MCSGFVRNLKGGAHLVGQCLVRLPKIFQRLLSWWIVGLLLFCFCYEKSAFADSLPIIQFGAAEWTSALDDAVNLQSVVSDKTVVWRKFTGSIGVNPVQWIRFPLTIDEKTAGDELSLRLTQLTPLAANNYIVDGAG